MHTKGWLSLGFLMLLALFGVFCVSAQTQTSEQLDLERIRRATVFIMQVRNVGTNFIVTCVGSGTLVSRNGLILTNAHNVLTNADCPGDVLIISLSIRSDEPPVPKYRAEVVQANAGIDLALLRITRQLDGRLVQSDNLALPFVELADSSMVTLDQTIAVVGYPGVGDDPVTVEVGVVSGFTTEPSYTADKSWIKTSASIRGTMSGGGAYNRDSQLIGIPTTAPVTRQDFATRCVAIQDTNADGLVNNNDVCIPIGGFINALRPSNFARPLLRAAVLGLSVEKLTASETQFRTLGVPRFRRLFFSPAVVDNMPTTVIRSLPTSSNSLYLFFDYENMTPETIYELRVTVDGVPNQTLSLAPVRWGGGERGLWYIGTSEQPLANGIYEFALVVNGVTSETRRLVVGGAPESEPIFTNIVFGLEDTQGNVLGNGYVLPTGPTASARFVYRNIPDGTEWTQIWYYNGGEVVRIPGAWNLGESGSTTVRIQPTTGLQPGQYRLELYLGTNLAATADFVIAGVQSGAFPQVFTDVHFASALSPSEALTASPVTNLPNRIDTLYTLFDWQRIAQGTYWTMRWSVDGDVFYQQTVPWSTADTGENFLTQLSGTLGIPDGTYKMDLLVNNFQLVSTQAQVGIGQLPIDRFSRASGVQFRGQILDANTGKGIPGVTFILISANFSVREFVWDQNQIYALAVTDRNGRFQIDRPLEFGAPYSVMVATEGYLPVSVDGVRVTPETPNPLEIVIELTRG